MGCCITKSTYNSYINQLKDLTKQADDLEDNTMNRRSLNKLTSIDPEDTIDYLQYQEQLRTQKFIQTLKKLTSNITQTPTNTLLTPSDYFQSRLEQTEFNESITNKFTEIAKKLEDIHNVKTIEFNERLQKLQNFIKTKISAEDPKLQELIKQFEHVKGYKSINELTESLVRLSELQKDLELLQRKYDYKHFLDKQLEKNKEKENLRARIEEIKVHIEKLNSNWAEMKDEQRKKAEEMQLLQDTVALNKAKIVSLNEEKEDLQHDLSKYGKSNSGFEETQNEITQKEELLGKLKKELEDLQSAINDHKADPYEMEILKKRKSFMNSEVQDMNKQVEYLNDLQRLAAEESTKKNEESLLLRNEMIQELKEEIAQKTAQMVKINQMYVNDLKNQIALNIVHQYEEHLKSCIRVWNLNASKMTETQQSEGQEARKSFHRMVSNVKTDSVWDRIKLLNFFSQFLSEKLKEDKAALSKNKLPIPLHEFIEPYLKTIYSEDCNIQCRQMMNTLLSDTQDPLFQTFKSMLSLSKEPFSYSFSLFLTEASYSFDLSKNPITDSVPFDKAIELVEAYSENNKEVIIPTLYRMKPETMSNEEYVLLMLKLNLKKIGKSFTDLCDSPDLFMEVSKKDLELLVEDKVLEDFKEKCEKEFDFNFDMKVEMSVNALQAERFSVDRTRFLGAFVEGYRESRTKATSGLETLVAGYEMITEEKFTQVMISIDPDLTLEIISKLFNEAVMENSEISTIKPQHFIQIVLKYGVGGLGIGYYNINKLKSVSNSVLKASIRVKKQDSIRKPANPYGIKISAASGSAKPPTQLSPKNSLLKSGTRITKLSEIRKSMSPNSSQSQKNLRKEPFYKKMPSLK